MVIERQNQDVVIRLNSSVVPMKDIQKFLDYFDFLESTAKNQGTEEQAAKLAREVHSSWWNTNKHRFLPS